MRQASQRLRSFMAVPTAGQGGRAISTVARGAAVLALLLLLVSCGGEAPDGASASFGAQTFTIGQVDTLALDLEIGTVAGRPEETFGNVRDIEVAPDGSIYVLDASLGTVRVFGPGGEYLRSLGRRGEGPGELRQPMRMRLAPDGTLWIYEAAVGADLVLAPDGTEVARYRALPHDPFGGVRSSRWDETVDGSGRLTQIVQHVDPQPGVAPGVWETQSRFFARSLDPGTGAVDSVHLGDDRVRHFRYRSRFGGPTTETVEFARRLVALNGDGSVWRALSNEYVLQRTSNGDTPRVRVAAEPAPFTAEERTRWEEGEPERLALGITLPERGHVLWRLFTDDENRLWVHRAQGFGWTNQFDVFAADGRLLGSVFLPGSMLPTANTAVVVRAGNLYAVMRDDLGVSSVIRAPLPVLR